MITATWSKLTIMPLIYPYLRARSIRSGLAINFLLGTLSACQSLPQPTSETCECPTLEQMCPSLDTLDTENDPALAPTLALAHPAMEAEQPQPQMPPPVAKTSPPVTEPAPKPAVSKPKPPAVVDNKPVVGRTEYVMIRPDNLKVRALIDTGTRMTSLIAANMVRFERDGKPWVRFAVPARNQSKNSQKRPKAERSPAAEDRVYEKPVKRFIETRQPGGESQSRPVVELILELGPVKELVDVALTDKGDGTYQLLIGRNFLRDRAIVDVSRKFSIKTI